MFVVERVDVAVVEVGIGGRADATNCVSVYACARVGPSLLPSRYECVRFLHWYSQPIVCGVTSLGYDHCYVLGDTIEEISAEKAGIFKRGVPAFSYAQLPGQAKFAARGDEWAETYANND